MGLTERNLNLVLTIMLRAAVVLCLMGLSSAIVCTPELCEGVTQPLLSCQGGIIKQGGFCGCTDVCAKVEGEHCQAELTFGLSVSAGTCDSGLHCVREEHLASGMGVCRRMHHDIDLGYKPDHHHKRQLGSTSKPQTLCQRMRLSSMISMVVYGASGSPSVTFSATSSPCSATTPNTVSVSTN